MSSDPTFFLTAGGEFSPLAEPRACRPKRRLRGQQGAYFLAVQIDPPLHHDERTFDEIVVGPFYTALEEHFQTPYSVYVYLIVSKRAVKPWTAANATPRLPWWEALRYAPTVLTRGAEVFRDRAGAVTSPRI